MSLNLNSVSPTPYLIAAHPQYVSCGSIFASSFSALNVVSPKTNVFFPDSTLESAVLFSAFVPQPTNVDAVSVKARTIATNFFIINTPFYILKISLLKKFLYFFNDPDIFLGSIASRSVSPKRLKITTEIKIAIPGDNTTHG